MKIQIKKATTLDIKEIANLFNLYRIFYKQDCNIELAEKFISERINNDESIIFYALSSEGQYLGFTQLYPIFSSVSAQKSWVLNDLYVDSSARRLGAAKLLMNHVKQFAIESGANGIALETCIDNTKAQALYESLGYEKEEDFYCYFLSL